MNEFLASILLLAQHSGLKATFYSPWDYSIELTAGFTKGFL